MPDTAKITIGFTMEVPLLEGFEAPTILQRNTLQVGDMYRHLSAYASYYALSHVYDNTPPFAVTQTTNTTELVVGWRKLNPITPADGWQESKHITRVDKIKYTHVAVVFKKGSMGVMTSVDYQANMQTKGFAAHYTASKFSVLQNIPTN